jgi:hypothetical protein
MRTITEIVLHCSDSGWGDALEINRWHHARGFSWPGYLLAGDHSACERSIGYHFAILGPRQFPDADGSCLVLDGQIQPGRPLESIGAHAVGHNTSSVGICLVGRDEFSDAQLSALHRLVTYLCGSLGVSTLKVIGHYECEPAKSCPNLPMGMIRDWLSDPAGACAQSITSLQGALLAERARRKG